MKISRLNALIVTSFLNIERKVLFKNDKKDSMQCDKHWKAIGIDGLYRSGQIGTARKRAGGRVELN